MQYTLRGIPDEVDQALRAKAHAEGKNLNQAAIDAIRSGLGITDPPVSHTDLNDLIGTWVEDPEFDRLVQEQDQIDPEMWR